MALTKAERARAAREVAHADGMDDALQAVRDIITDLEHDAFYGGAGDAREVLTELLKRVNSIDTDALYEWS